MKKELVTVLIPIHRDEPSELEKISLQQTLTVLHKHPITFMTREGVNTAWYEEFCQGKAKVYFERFKWNGYIEFSELLTSHKFYGRFRAYEYLLICHLDAFVFRDELEKWCSFGYDYLGAFIYNPAWDYKIPFQQRLLGFKKPEYYGNGGFALKKVDTFYRITSKYKLYIDLHSWIRKIRKRGVMDDIFSSQLFPSLWPSFKMAPKLHSQQFGAAYEYGDDKSLPFSNSDMSSLPFGIHGWIQYQPEYWKPPLRELGYKV